MLSKNISLIKNCKLSLERIFRDNIDTYIDLFFYEKAISLDRQSGETLARVGILRPVGDNWLANVMVFPFRNKFIVTDFLLSAYRKKGGKYIRGLDDVWVMFPHETLLFIERFDGIHGNQALDIASGSGAISLFLTEKFDKVISSDINPRAVSFSRFNAILNNLEGKIINIQSDLFKALDRYKFDYICWNGPTVAMPEVQQPEKVYPLYTYGGFDGAQFTRKFLNEVFRHVNKNFKVRWWDGSLGDSKEAVVEKYIKETFSNLPIQVTIEFLNKRRGVPLKEYEKAYCKYCLDKFDLNQKYKDKDKTVKNWYRKLKSNNLTHVYISIISIEPNNKFSIVYKDTYKTFVSPRHVFGFEWHYTSRRFIKSYLLLHNK